ncbi:MAG: efflux RND transporter permease subunit [Paraglaciecola sp.]|uniref:efflux RND transporter permease subunit n=1 Tax=Paraglaciecola sp. TaxID=1920173 RepID=UPI00326619DC
MHSNKQAFEFFSTMLSKRWIVSLPVILVFIALISGISSLQKDTSSDAFIDPLNPALVANKKIEEVFGLSDPLVIAIVNNTGTGIFTPDSLELVDWVTRTLSKQRNVDPDKIISLATESNIEGDSVGMNVEEFITSTPISNERTSWIKHAIDHFPLYQGLLVSKDHQATIVVAELLDETESSNTYHNIKKLLDDAPLGNGNKLFIAGEGAVSGYLSTYIDNDAKKLNPLAAVIITIILFICFRTLRGIILPNLIVILTAGSTLGAMALFGVDFYVITNGLVVCMIGIAVADSVHIFSQYYTEIASNPSAQRKQIVANTMANVWRPITLTTFTTMAGFLGLAVTSDMPPVIYFGLFGALSVFFAWLFSITILPILLSCLTPKLSKRFLHKSKDTVHRSSFITYVGKAILKRPHVSVWIGAILFLISLVGANQVTVDEERIANFKETEDIFIADKTINSLMDGTYYLDIFIDAKDPEALYQPEILQKIEATQRKLETLPQVGGTTSIVDYIKQMNKAINEDDETYYRIPKNPQLIAQLFLLYFSSGDPTEFEEEIDGERKLALIRANVARNKYSNNKLLVEEMSPWLAKEFSDENVTATLTGRIQVDYEWIDNLAKTNTLSVVVSILAVVIMASLLFKSAVAGFLAFIPVGLSILIIYAVMGISDIWLGVGTSMFASIAIGLGVDFAIHTIDRMKELIANSSKPRAEQLIVLYATTGRALLFNFLAIALGFGVLMTSDVPPLIKFGSLVVISVTTSFIASLAIVPSLVMLFKPKFLYK